MNQRVAVLTRAPSVSAPRAQVSQSSIDHGMKVICKQGLPSHAFEDIIFRDGHVLAWDRRNRIPLWVAQHISSSSLAAAKAAAEARKLKRHSNFTEEPSIPDVFKSKLSDYKGSGYDRGHMVLYKSYTYARGGMGARIMRTGARIRTHARAYLPQSFGLGWRACVRSWRGVVAVFNDKII